MANYATSDLTTAQALLVGAFANQEIRFRTPVTHLEFLRQSEIMLPSYQELRKREDRAIDTFFNDRVVRALGSGRVHNHTGAKGTSSKFSPTWLTNSDKFAISLKQGDQNMFSNAEMLANEMKNVMVNFVDGMDADAESHVFSNRSTENLATQQGTFDATDHHFKILEADENRAVQITQTVMDTNKFSGNITLFCDSISHDKFEAQRFQGSGNAENLTFNFNSNVKIIHSLGMDAFAAALTTPVTKGFWIAVVDGTIAALPWIPKQNRMGVTVQGITEYGSIINPIDGLTLATHKYSERSDQSALNGSAQDVLTEWEISVDVALDNAPFNFTGSEPTSSLLAFSIV